MREALRECDIRGLPFAGRTSATDGEGAPVWEQRELWDYGTYELNVNQHVTLAKTNHSVAKLMAYECFEKFGKAPSVPTMVGVVAGGPDRTIEDRRPAPAEAAS